LSDDVLIRAADKNDFAQCKVLWDGYNEFYGRKGPTALPDTVTHMTWSRFFDGYEPMQALVAEHSGQKWRAMAHLGIGGGGWTE
jgi:hypothetical protein